MTTLHDLAHEHYTRDELYHTVSEYGRTHSAVDICKTFCTPPNKKDILLTALDSSSRKYGQYTHDSVETLTALEEEGRVLRPKNPRQLVDYVANCEAHQIVVIPSPFFSGHKQPLKRSETLPVRRARKEADRKPIDDAITDAMRTVPPNKILTGYDFQGIHYTKRNYEMIALVDVIRGHLYHNALHVTIRADCYEGSTPSTTGARAAVTQIPSFHDPKKDYKVFLAGIPVYRGTRKDKIPNHGFDITSLGESPREFWDVIKFKRDISGQDFPRGGHEKRWDHHTILAYLRAAQKLEQDNWNVVKPFPEPNAKTFQLYFKLLNNTLVATWNPEKNKHDLKSPTIAQTEELLWRYIGHQNYLRSQKVA